MHELRKAQKKIMTMRRMAATGKKRKKMLAKPKQ